ncbi:MAG: 16S rRNA (cytidine(1402)-2'-O)-methyltransferase, partial [Patescibacteria group bacterium]
GNLKDITLRALEVLRSVDLVVCEDTRQTIKLLNHFEIKKPLLSYFQHSRISKVEQIAANLRSDKNLALVTDAGTPGIADPGGKLIKELRGILGENFRIVPIPGANAAVAALSISGLPADRFLFLGFPPAKKGRQKFFREVAQAEHTVVFYESSHRILKTLKELTTLAPERETIVCRELTKMFETIYRGKLDDILKKLMGNKNNLKGEFVIVL